MLKLGIAVVSLVAAAAPVAAADGALDVSRQALRDGLWGVAREHARGVTGDEARLVVLESYAREGRWDEVLRRLEEWGDATAPAFAYYRAAAQFRAGNVGIARAILERTDFGGAPCETNAARLTAEILIGAGERPRALAVLKPWLATDCDARMLAASVHAREGDRQAAERLWREVLACTNAAESALAAAGASLGETNVLARLAESARTAETRRAAGLSLGLALLARPGSAAEGERRIRAIVRDAPDAPGARAAFLALADAALERGDFADASAVYVDALEMWPDSARDAALQEGRGWAFAGLGRHAEALEALRLAEGAATNDAARAMVRVKIGDTLSAAGRLDEAMAEYRAVLADHPGTPAGVRVAEVIRIRETEAAGRDDFAAYRFAAAQRKFAAVARADSARAPQMAFYDVLCLYGQGRDAEAEAAARAILESGSDAAIRLEATLWLAKFSYNRGKWRDAESLFIAYADGAPASESAPDALVWAARSAFAAGDSARAVQLVTRLATDHPDAAAAAKGLVIQGEALIELARFDESVLILERAAIHPAASAADRQRARMLRADALFAMGADNPVRYQEALDAYRALRLGESQSPSALLVASYKVARTLEKLKRIDEAVDQYYSQVVLAYRKGRGAGESFDEEARAAFSRAAFRLAEEYESRGRDAQAAHILELVTTSDVPAAEEAVRRRERLIKKGGLL